MSTIINKLQHISRNRRSLESEVGKIIRLLLLSQATNAFRAPLSVLKRIKTYFESSTGNNQLHALILVHVHKNILNNINVADVVSEFFDKNDSRKQTFGHFSQNHS